MNSTHTHTHSNNNSNKNKKRNKSMKRHVLPRKFSIHSSNFQIRARIARRSKGLPRWHFG